VAVITTFSLGAYISFGVLFLFFMHNKGLLKSFKISIPIILLLLITFSFVYFQKMKNFMLNKSENYAASITQTEDFIKEPDVKKNRVQGVIAGAKMIAKSPIGYGLSPKNKDNLFHSSNGFINILLKYGIPGVIIIIYLLVYNFKFLRWKYNDKIKGKWLFLIVLLLTYNGNPFYHQPLFLSSMLIGWLNIKYLPFKNIRYSKKLSNSSNQGSQNSLTGK
jgi:hypothetical protein